VAAMADIYEKSITNSIARYIRTSRRQVSILFTDIEYSTLLWDIRGDIEGRLMVDKHNRLLFPVIHEFRGRVLKTIGDAIMASFKTPEDALKAAVGIQQALQQARQEDEGFYLKVRIGIHTGMAIVEHNDVYGDVVNMASRIESEASGDEILLSEAAASKLKDRGFFLVEEGTFIFKGKRAPMKVYRCEWQLCPNLLGQVRFESFLPVGARQKIDLLIYAAATAAIVFFVYSSYLRYVLADTGQFSMVLLNPHLIFEIHPLIPALFAALLTLALLLLRRMRRVPLWLLRLLQGGFGLSVGFFLIYVPSLFIASGFAPVLGEGVIHARHAYAEVRQDDVAVRRTPEPDSVRLRSLAAGQVLLVQDTEVHAGTNWALLEIEGSRTGWVPETITGVQGGDAIRLLAIETVRLRWLDLLALLGGIGGFLYGFMRFRIKPT
jgi:class 3 adenylate cyclase